MLGKWYLLTLSVYLCDISHWDIVFKAIHAFSSVDNAVCFHGKFSNVPKVYFKNNYKCICSEDFFPLFDSSLYLHKMLLSGIRVKESKFMKLEGGSLS